MGLPSLPYLIRDFLSGLTILPEDWILNSGLCLHEVNAGIQSEGNMEKFPAPFSFVYIHQWKKLK